MNNFAQYLKSNSEYLQVPHVVGKVVAVSDGYFEANLPGALIGNFVIVEDKLAGQIVGVSLNSVKITPLERISTIAVGDKVYQKYSSPVIPCGFGLIGRVVDSMCKPVDSKGELDDISLWPLSRQSPDPLKRKPVCEISVSGIKVIDSLLSIGKGQKTGLFAGAGEGKSTLLSDFANGSSFDITIICLVGERGREAGEFINNTLGSKGLSKSVVILATSDASMGEKILALQSATAVAEWFREQGKSVLLLVDSLTRVVRAKRDLDLHMGAIAAPSGFPASAFGFLPQLLERATSSDKGTITAIYAILTENNQNDPIGEEVRSLLDGHIVLSQKRARAALWPAVDVASSISRVFSSVTSKEHQQYATQIRSVISAYESNEDLVLIGAYEKGSCKKTDAYLKYQEQINDFLTQQTSNFVSYVETLKEMKLLYSLLS